MIRKKVYPECRACGSDRTIFKKMELEKRAMKRGVKSVFMVSCKSCSELTITANISNTKKAKREIERVLSIMEYELNMMRSTGSK